MAYIKLCWQKTFNFTHHIVIKALYRVLFYLNNKKTGFNRLTFFFKKYHLSLIRFDFYIMNYSAINDEVSWFETKSSR